MVLDRSTRNALLAVVVVLGFLARAATFASPLLDFHSWRQADTAAVSRNFMRDGLNPLEARVDWIGPTGGSRVVTGLELHALIVAAICRALPRFEPGVGRVVSAIWFMVSASLLWSLARRRYGDGPAVAGTLIYGFGYPLAFYVERAFMNEALLVALALGALHEGQRYVHERRRAALLSLAGCLVLVAVIKPTFLVVGCAIAGLFAEKRGWQTLVAWEGWLLALAAGGACAAWFLHMTAAVGDAGVSFGLADKLWDSGVLMSFRYHSLIATRLVKDILGPVGVVTIAAGVVHATRRGWRMEVFGLAGFLVYLLTVVVGNFAHNYYQVVLIPVAAPTVGLGAWWLVTRRLSDPLPIRTVALRVLIIGAVAAGTTLIRFAGPYSWFRVDWTKRHVCDVLRRDVRADETIVFGDYQSPDLLFCANHRGWLLSPAETSAESIARLAAKGASVLVLDRDWESRKGGQPYGNAGTLLVQNSRFTIVRLR